MAILDNYSFAIVDYLPGVPLRYLLVKTPSIFIINQLMNDIGIILSKIASFTFKSSGFFDDNLNIITSTETDANILEYAQECLENHTVIAVLGKTMIEEIGSYLKESSKLLPNSNSKNLVHGDFDPANILINEVNGKLQISGILDWEFAFSGSPLWDIANMLRYSHKMPCEFKDSFIKSLTENGLELPDDWQKKIELLNLTSLLDCLKRADACNKPNQCADIFELIKYILSSANNESQK